MMLITVLCNQQRWMGTVRDKSVRERARERLLHILTQPRRRMTDLIRYCPVPRARHPFPTRLTRPAWYFAGRHLLTILLAICRVRNLRPQLVRALGLRRFNLIKSRVNLSASVSVTKQMHLVLRENIRAGDKLVSS